MIFWTSFGGSAGVPGKLASGFKIVPGAVGGLGVMVLPSEEAISAGVIMVNGRLEAVKGRRRGSAGSEENAGKPRAETRGGGGGNSSGNEPEIKGGGHCNSKCYASRVQSGVHEYDKAGVHEWSRLVMGDARPLPGAANH